MMPMFLSPPKRWLSSASLWDFWRRQDFQGDQDSAAQVRLGKASPAFPWHDSPKKKTDCKQSAWFYLQRNGSCCWGAWDSPEVRLILARNIQKLFCATDLPVALVTCLLLSGAHKTRLGVDIWTVIRWNMSVHWIKGCAIILQISLSGWWTIPNGINYKHLTRKTQNHNHLQFQCLGPWKPLGVSNIMRSVGFCWLVQLLYIFIIFYSRIPLVWIHRGAAEISCISQTSASSLWLPSRKITQQGRREVSRLAWYLELVIQRCSKQCNKC